MTAPQELKEMIERDLENLISEVSRFVETQRLSRFVEDIPLPAKVEDVHSAVDELVNNLETRPEAAVRAITSVGALDAELAYLDARIARLANLQQIQQAVSNAWNNIKTYLQPIIQSISQHLWQLIAQLLTLKEWSISGNAGVNAFGLTGTVQLQLTFGK
jgi:hypothetical protein